ncbi:MAG: tagaturonate reductase, partial [Defluviitaleaceae bacterium]|nr:tagaturonate reductase [Defluviitaleaceae bacterium]
MKSVSAFAKKPSRPIKILQYGGGNFLRGFVEYMIDVTNEKGLFDGNVQIIKATESGSSFEPLKAQDCVYTLILRGKRDGGVYVEKRVITCVAGATSAYDEYETYAGFAKSLELRFIISNTTESGIVYDERDSIDMDPPWTFPGKLTKLLYERFRHFNGADDKGLIILPTELIDKNGATLREYCLKLAEQWKLPAEFADWVNNHNIFCNTLVDRIVTGYPKDDAEALEQELGYSDKLLLAGEPFAFWAVESDDPEAVARELPLDKAGLPVVFAKDIQPYKERKVRLLNGAHTSSVFAAYLSGLETVGDMMKDELMRKFFERAVYGEIAPMVPLPADEVKSFADSVVERFENPYIRHNLISITLNSVSKFRARLLPTILETQAKTNSLPKRLCFTLASLTEFYCNRENAYEVKDDAAVLDFFAENNSLPAG